MGAQPSCRARSPSSAPAPRAPRSPRRTRGSAPRCCCSRRSTACCRPRTPTSRKLAERGFKKQGIDVHTGTLGRERREPATTSVTFTYGDESGEVDYLVIAAGRGADVEGLGLDEAGVKLDEQRPDRGRRRAAHEPRRASTRSATSSPARRSRTRPPTRASSPSRTPPGCETHPIAYVDIPRATFCTPNVGSLRADRGAGARAGLRRRRRQGPVRRRRRRHRLRRPQRPDQDRRRQASTASCSAGTSSARARPS